MMEPVKAKFMMLMSIAMAVGAIIGHSTVGFPWGVLLVAVVLTANYLLVWKNHQ